MEVYELTLTHNYYHGDDYFKLGTEPYKRDVPIKCKFMSYGNEPIKIQLHEVLMNMVAKVEQTAKENLWEVKET